MNTRAEAQRLLATIRDPIGLAHAVLRNQRVDDRDEAVSFLLETLVVLAYRYDPALDKRGPDFHGYASHLLPLRLIDHIRKTKIYASRQANTGHLKDPVVYSLDVRDPGQYRPRGSHTGGTVDAGGDSDPEVLRRRLLGTDRRPPPYLEAQPNPGPRGSEGGAVPTDRVREAA